MSSIIPIFKYIIKNNPWYLVPLRAIQAIAYQCYKRTFNHVLTKKIFNGKKIYLYPKSPNSSAFVYAKIPDRNEILALRSFVDHNTIFLDVGANIGDYSVMLMDKVKMIYAFEAISDTALLCKKNFLLNGLNAEQVIVKAVSDNSHPKHFSHFGGGSPVNIQVPQGANTIEVPAITLDEFVAKIPKTRESNFVLKVDVEGFEHEVFNGAKKFLSEYPVKAIIFELFSERVDEVIKLVQTLGFSTKQISQNNMLCIK